MNIPFFNNNENAFLRVVLGGFQVNGVYQIQSGQPITLFAGRDANLNVDAAGDRAIFKPNGDPNISSRTTAYGLDANVNLVVLPLRDRGNPNLGILAYVANSLNAGYISTGFFAAELAN